MLLGLCQCSNEQRTRKDFGWLVHVEPKEKTVLYINLEDLW